ncbi:hypothetical protein FS837_004966, partial [Tulasnella sp. UAMH 9824]
MQEYKDSFENPSQASGLGQEASPGVPLHSSKLRNKLQKLARWRIDPSLIEFPQDAREFSGGFAKVSQGLLTSPSRAEEDVNESEDTTDEPLSSKAGGPQSDIDSQVPGENYRSDHEETDGQTADGGNDHTEGEGTKDNDKELKPYGQTLIQEAGYGLARSEHTVNEDPGPGDRNSLSERDAQRPEDLQPGNDEEMDRRVGGDDTEQTKEAPKRESGGAENGLHPDRQTPKPKVGDNRLL